MSPCAPFFFHNAFSLSLSWVPLFILIIYLLPCSAQLCSAIYASAANRMLWHINILNLIYSEGWENCSRWLLLLDKQQVILVWGKHRLFIFPPSVSLFTQFSGCVVVRHTKGSLASDNAQWRLKSTLNGEKSLIEHCWSPETLVLNSTTVTYTLAFKRWLEAPCLCWGIPLRKEFPYIVMFGKESSMSLNCWGSWAPGTWWVQTALTSRPALLGWLKIIEKFPKCSQMICGH